MLCQFPEQYQIYQETKRNLVIQCERCKTKYRMKGKSLPLRTECYGKQSLGDIIASILKRIFHIRSRNSCKCSRRKRKLNRWWWSLLSWKKLLIITLKNNQKEVQYLILLYILLCGIFY